MQLSTCRETFLLVGMKGIACLLCAVLFVTPARALALAKRDYTHYLIGRALIEGRLLDFVAK